MNDVLFFSASVLDRLNSLLEPNGSLTITERGVIDGQSVTIKPHPNFRLQNNVIIKQTYYYNHRSYYDVVDNYFPEFLFIKDSPNMSKQLEILESRPGV